MGGELKGLIAQSHEPNIADSFGLRVGGGQVLGVAFTSNHSNWFFCPRGWPGHLPTPSTLMLLIQMAPPRPNIMVVRPKTPHQQTLFVISFAIYTGASMPSQKVPIPPLALWRFPVLGMGCEGGEKMQCIALYDLLC